jgi:hypothetical protein
VLLLAKHVLATAAVFCRYVTAVTADTDLLFAPKLPHFFLVLYCSLL